MDDLNTDGQTDGGALRKQYEKALADLKAANDANAQLTSQVRAGSVKDLFGELKADSRGVKFYTGEPTKEALTEWLKSDGDVFATAPATAPVVPGTAPLVPATPTPGANPLNLQLPPGVTLEMLLAAQTASGMAPTPPVAPTADLEALTAGLSGRTWDKPEDGAAIDATWQAIRASAAAMQAAGMS